MEGSGGVPALRYRREMKKDRDACRFFLDSSQRVSNEAAKAQALAQYKAAKAQAWAEQWITQ